MTIALVDDSPVDLEILFTHTCRYCREHKIHIHIKKFTDEALFLKSARYTAYSLVFLDIYLKRSTGIQVAEKLREYQPRCQIIFATASKNHAVKAFRLRALDYLVKPYNYIQFSDAISRFDQTAAKFIHYIELKEGRRYTRIPVSDIIYTDYHNHYIQVHTALCTIRSHLYFKEFAPALSPYPQFLWCRRNCIVNMDFIESFDAKSFLLNDGTRLPISKAQHREITHAYTDYLLSSDRDSITL